MHHYMPDLKHLLISISILMFAVAVSYGQHDEGLIYGKVVTKSGNAYVGQIRWADEEVFWHDIFNSIKTYGRPTKIDIELKENDTEQKTREKSKWEFLEIWEDKYSGNIHQFTSRFGDLKSISPEGNDLVTLTFKNDFQILVNGGSNDIGTTVRVMDYELGELKIKWSNIDRIYFFDTPTKVQRKFGNCLYGTVRCESGYWTGMVQWDNDERLDVDQLDGYVDGKDTHIYFSNIRCIRKKDCASEVAQINDNTFLMSGTNDVNCENRGINVIVDNVGTITIPWNSFQQVCFDHSYRKTGDPYRSYPDPKRLSGTLRTIDHKKFMGYFVFDKDESWDFEMLEGKSEKIKYTIPFRNIESVSPRNNHSSTIKLRNGQTLLLEELQDVSAFNEGILIYSESKSEPTYVEWKNVLEIIFD